MSDPGRGTALRTRLMIGLLALLTVGLFSTAVISIFALRTYLFDQTDDQLRSAQNIVTARSNALLAQVAPTISIEGLQRAIAPTDYVVELRRRNGSVLVVTGSGSGPAPPRPLINAATDIDARVASGTPFTIVSDGRRFRAIARSLSAGGEIDLVAIPLRPVTATIARLAGIEIVAGIAVLTGAAFSAWLLLGRGLRPLRDVAETAAAIAGGDLSRRVPDSPARSEVGRLAAALNIMLGQIQSAFEERVRSQERLQRFVADASHELRTPLTSIRGYVDLMRQGVIPPADVDDALRRVQEESTRMSALVDDMLYLAHLDEHRPLERSDVDLAAVLRDAVADAVAVEPDRLIELTCPDRCVVVGDADALRQVVGNLLSNVRVHTPVTARVEATLVRDSARVHLTIRDFGPGMPSEAAERVFDRFWRASGSRGRVHGGSGLGMSIVAAVAAAHGGTADVRSAPGNGTTVRLVLPIGEPEPADPPTGNITVGNYAGQAAGPPR
ncbi:cell wall metabolism sensor histidine kinase WalK [Frankia sp. CiP3]|uniref:sensor histidine kinase n=1 Tax=Frankia sp. CiP3 TaxID=2880971 RepID=UPI001EF4EA37|nr:HAMP domain-containing sensor histidine kinase [Frankia sp. CiP3]